MSVITLCCGPAGSGKSYTRSVWHVLNTHWPEGRRVITTVPVRPDRLAAHYGRDDAPGVDVIDPPASWRDGTSGPWDLDLDIAQSVIIIDEAHNFVSTTHPAKHRRRWGEWLGELRHQGARCELMTQALTKLPLELRRECGRVIRISTLDDHRDPVMGVRISDLCQLIASIRRSPCKFAAEAEEIEDGGRRRRIQRRLIPLRSELFDCYDSFAAPIGGGISAREPEPWERFGPGRMFARLCARNAFPLGIRLGLVAGLGWLTFGGGAVMAFDRISGALTGRGSEFSSSADAPSVDAPTTDVRTPPPTAPSGPFIRQRCLALASNGVAMFRGGAVRVGERVPGTDARLVAIDYDRRLVIVATVGSVAAGEEFIVNAGPGR